MGSLVFGADSGRFDGDELLSLKVFNVLGNRVPAHSNCPTNDAVARIALVGLPVLAVHQIGINGNFS